ncbi:Phenoloxidase-activating factor 2 [Eumeta japonica]|uniref:Phenoloxidase-activating factor 2 n=1 Tax=Eumeta variegata TaxID=151549 RepID=A0A4C1V2V1_EUMVA|nr:Phenoloxidase-activating factor 2 [Eumeta japonica]
MVHRAEVKLPFIQYYKLCHGSMAKAVVLNKEAAYDIYFYEKERSIRKGPCDSYLESCCVSSDRRRPDRPIIPKSDERLEQLKDAGCGRRNPEGVGFRIKGDDDGEAEFGEFPWMVAVLSVRPVDAYDLEGPKTHAYLGGGSLIHHSVVLTAAHYLANATSLVARVGEWDTQTVNEIYPFQDRNVAEVEIHKDFNPGNLFYDIALLFLESPVTVAPNVGLACLPQPEDRPPLNGRCFASGWGKNKFGREGNYQVIMKKVNLPVVEHSACQEQLRRTRLGRFFKLHSSFMCAGGEPGRDTCKGDGGSPLVCPIEGRYSSLSSYRLIPNSMSQKACSDKLLGSALLL